MSGDHKNIQELPSSLRQNLHETARGVCFWGGERPGLWVYTYVYVCNKILYKRTPYKEEQTSNWSVSMTCLGLVRKGRKVSKSKHQLIIRSTRCLPYPSSISEPAKQKAWWPGLLFYWDSSTPPEVLLDGIATLPFPECNCTRSQTQQSQWTGCRDVEAEEPIEVLVTVLYVKPQCELSCIVCICLPY